MSHWYYSKLWCKLWEEPPNGRKSQIINFQMSAPSAKMLVSIGERSAMVQISGRANFTSSVDFKTLLDQLLQRGYTCFILDLTECVLMDSTFLGVLAGFGLKLNSPQTDKIDRTIQLFNPNS